MISLVCGLKINSDCSERGSQIQRTSQWSPRRENKREGMVGPGDSESQSTVYSIRYKAITIFNSHYK